MRVAPIGPSNGISEMESAAEAPIMARGSNGFSWSDDRGVSMTWTSFLKPFGKRGRTGLSVILAMRMALVLGRPSRRKKLPGIFPLAYILSSKSTDNGKKSMPVLGLDMVAVASITLSP